MVCQYTDGEMIQLQRSHCISATQCNWVHNKLFNILSECWTFFSASIRMQPYLTQEWLIQSSTAQSWLTKKWKHHHQQVTINFFLLKQVWLNCWFEYKLAVGVCFITNTFINTDRLLSRMSTKKIVVKRININ